MSTSSDGGSFSGLMDSSDIIGLTWDLTDNYIIPNGKKLYITNYYSELGDNYYLNINDIAVYKGLSNYDQYGGVHQPLILNFGDVVSGN